MLLNLLLAFTVQTCEARGWVLVRLPSGQEIIGNGTDGMIRTARGETLPLEAPDLLIALLRYDLTPWLLEQGFFRFSRGWVHPPSGTEARLETSGDSLVLYLLQDSLVLLKAVRTPTRVRIGDTLRLHLLSCDTAEVQKVLRWPLTPIPSSRRALPQYPAYSPLLFRLYKTTLSIQQGDLCNFRPTCSEYALLSLQRHGLLGLIMAFERLLRDHKRAGGQRDRYSDVMDPLGRLKRWDPP